ncbi:hypothetical protein HDU96_005581 [Phlyctochytrium bullatum]|nr:hypothetical protein HDU96_005581 [Phlyctochytrium bullatum]
MRLVILEHILTEYGQPTGEEGDISLDLPTSLLVPLRKLLAIIVKTLDRDSKTLAREEETVAFEDGKPLQTGREDSLITPAILSDIKAIGRELDDIRLKFSRIEKELPESKDLFPAWL